MTRALAVIAVLVNFSGCSECLNACPNLQRLVFQGPSGAPLTPLQVTEGQTVHRCGDLHVTCDGNTFSFDLEDFGAHPIRAEAQSGEVFAGQLVPVAQEGMKTRVGACECVVDTLRPITLTLSPP
jgi:hypothetical protein